MRTLSTPWNRTFEIEHEVELAGRSDTPGRIGVLRVYIGKSGLEIACGLDKETALELARELLLMVRSHDMENGDG